MKVDDSPWEVFQYPIDKRWTLTFESPWPEITNYFQEYILKHLSRFCKQFTESRIIEYEEYVREWFRGDTWIVIRIGIYGVLPE